MTETLYVNAFGETVMLWNTHTGVNPFLQAAVGNEIGAYTDGAIDNAFGFADTAITVFSTITSIKLRGQAASNNADHMATLLLSGSSGGAWSVTVYFLGNGAGTYIDNISADLKATINSLARINECSMKATKVNVAGAGTLALRWVYLEIVVAVPVTENIMDGLVQC
jgi:hypothetical protein